MLFLCFFLDRYFNLGAEDFLFVIPVLTDLAIISRIESFRPKSDGKEQ